MINIILLFFLSEHLFADARTLSVLNLYQSILHVPGLHKSCAPPTCWVKPGFVTIGWNHAWASIEEGNNGTNGRNIPLSLPSGYDAAEDPDWCIVIMYSPKSKPMFSHWRTHAHNPYQHSPPFYIDIGTYSSHRDDCSLFVSRHLYTLPPIQITWKMLTADHHVLVLEGWNQLPQLPSTRNAYPSLDYRYPKHRSVHDEANFPSSKFTPWSSRSIIFEASLSPSASSSSSRSAVFNCLAFAIGLTDEWCVPRSQKPEGLNAFFFWAKYRYVEFNTSTFSSGAVYGHALPYTIRLYGNKSLATVPLRLSRDTILHVARTFPEQHGKNWEETNHIWTKQAYGDRAPYFVLSGVQAISKFGVGLISHAEDELSNLIGSPLDYVYAPSPSSNWDVPISRHLSRQVCDTMRHPMNDWHLDKSFDQLLERLGQDNPQIVSKFTILFEEWMEQIQHAIIHDALQRCCLCPEVGVFTTTFREILDLGKTYDLIPLIMNKLRHADQSGLNNPYYFFSHYLLSHLLPQYDKWVKSISAPECKKHLAFALYQKWVQIQDW